MKRFRWTPPQIINAALGAVSLIAISVTGVGIWFQLRFDVQANDQRTKSVAEFTRTISETLTATISRVQTVESQLKWQIVPSLDRIENALKRTEETLDTKGR